MESDTAPSTLTRLSWEVLALMPGSSQTRAIPIALIVMLLQALAAALQVCEPTPAKAAATLVEPPLSHPFLRAQWQEVVCEEVAEKWSGTVDAIRPLQVAILERLRQGIDVETVEAAFVEINQPE